MHGLVLAKPGFSERSCFGFEEKTLGAYFGTEIFTMQISEMWTVAGPAKFITNVRSDRSGVRPCTTRSYIGHIDKFVVPSLLDLVLQKRDGGGLQRLADVLIRWGSDPETPLAYCMLVEPLADLVSCGHWSTFACQRKAPLPSAGLHPTWVNK